MTFLVVQLGAGGYPPLPSPEVFNTPGAFSVTIPYGATSVAIVCAGSAGQGGGGGGFNEEFGGGGGGTGGVSLGTLSLTALDWGKSISLVVGQTGFSATSSTVVYNGVTLVGNPGGYGLNATNTGVGAGGSAGTAAGGTTNTMGNPGSGGTNSDGGDGGAAPSSGVGPGGDGGFGVGGRGGPGVNGLISLSWS